MSGRDRTAGDQGLAELRLEEPTRPERRSRRVRWFFSGCRHDPRPSRLGTLESPDPDAVGICCSGGGIRSAAFNLGALQALQQRSILQDAKYLAAVSGGSYIAAAFCMVAKRDDPAADDSDPKAFDDAHPPFHPGSPEEQYLRNRSSYLAPDGLSKLFLAYRVLLGLVFNLLFLGCALVAIGIALGTLSTARSTGRSPTRRFAAPSGRGRPAASPPTCRRASSSRSSSSASRSSSTGSRCCCCGRGRTSGAAASRRGPRG